MSHKPLGFMQLTIIVGFSLYYAWYLIAFFGLFMSVPADGDFAAVHAGQVVFFGANVLATMGILAYYRKADSVALGHKRLMYLASLLPGSALPAYFIADQLAGPMPVGALYAACLLAGVSMAVGFMQWEDLSSHGYLNRGVLAHGTIFCAGGVLFLLGTLFMSPLQLAMVAELLLCASTALIAFILPRCDTIEDKPIAPVREYFRGVWHLDTVIAVLNMAFGYAFVLLFWEGQTILLAAMGIAIFIDIVFSITFGRGKWVIFGGAVRVCVAIVSCALILFACPGDPARDIALCVIIVFWFLFRTVNGGSLTNLANRHDFSMQYSALRGKLPANIGFTIGLGIGVVAAAFNIPDVVIVYIPLAMTAAFILSSLFLLPFDSESPTAGYKTLALEEMQESPDTDMTALCNIVSKRFKLSPRESEVLVFLVKGRNAKHISEKLFISESTAKTHISNIYRKVGVHSQQELLDELDGIDYRPPGRAR